MQRKSIQVLLFTLMFVPAAARAAAGLIVTPTEMFLSEPAGTASYTVRLSDQPTGAVTVTVSDEDNPGGLSDVTVETPPGPAPDSNAVTLTFTTLNYATPQTITVRVVDDHSAQGTHDTTITNRVTQSTDVGYLTSVPVAVAVHIADDDHDGVSLIESGASTLVAETSDPTFAGDTYTLALTASPGSHSVTITPAANPQLSFNPSSVTFTAANYSTPQTITVKAVDDSVAETTPHATTITHSIAVAPSGGAYDPAADNPILVPNVIVAILDNDSKALALIETGTGTAVRGDEFATYPDTANSDKYTVYLTKRPAHPVTVEITADDGMSVTPSVLTFNAGDEGIGIGKGKVVSVTATAPGQPGFVHHRVVSEDGEYNGLSVSDIAVCRIEQDADGNEVGTQCPDAVGKDEAVADSSGGALELTTLLGLLGAMARRRRGRK